MKAQEVRGKEDQELRDDIVRLEKEIFSMKFRAVTEGNSDPAKIERSRRDIARMKTILAERKRGIRGQEPR